MSRFGPTIKWQKTPKIDLWEITGCAQIQEIEKPDSKDFCYQNALKPRRISTKLKGFDSKPQFRTGIN
jgi:hypothetical protein